MKAKQFITFILALSSFVSFSQKKIKYKTVYFEDNGVETPNAKVSFFDVISEDALITGSLKIENKTGL